MSVSMSISVCDSVCVADGIGNTPISLRLDTDAKEKPRWEDYFLITETTLHSESDKVTRAGPVVTHNLIDKRSHQLCCVASCVWR